ncbi:hypothetical protein vfu_A02829 [Vibrio furnissii NCTC 11218]|nr:hypothetical protein vfu_A02829 [Vibrio furnissii NCTC 11218]
MAIPSLIIEINAVIPLKRQDDNLHQTRKNRLSLNE